MQSCRRWQAGRHVQRASHPERTALRSAHDSAPPVSLRHAPPGRASTARAAQTNQTRTRPSLKLELGTKLPTTNNPNWSDDRASPSKTPAKISASPRQARLLGREVRSIVWACL
eukprot:1189191-Prorocentrum_minimum.AAC.1